MSSRRPVARLAMIVTLVAAAVLMGEAARAETAPAAAKPPAAAPATPAPAAPTPAAPTPAAPIPAAPASTTPPKPAPPPVKAAVEPIDKNEAVAILGRPVTGAEGQQIGRLTDVLVDGTGQPQAAVLDIGGFMGLGSRTIAVHWDTLHFAPTDPKAPIKLSLTLDQIKAVPEYKGLDEKPAPVVVKVDTKPAPAH